MHRGGGAGPALPPVGMKLKGTPYTSAYSGTNRPSSPTA